MNPRNLLYYNILTMKIFVTGSTGLLGSSLLRNAPKAHTLYASYNINTLVPNVACKYYLCDITKKAQVNEVIKKIKPDVVIHTAAIATPDYCDKHKSEAKAVNINGTKYLIEACKIVGAKFVYITTNGVYDGKKAPYDEAAKPNPVDYYGVTKATGEKMTRESGVDFIIMRLITMYGWNNPKERQNPVTWQLKILGENKNPLNMVSDMYNNFLYVEDAAKAIWKAVGKKQYGESFNIAGRDCESRYDFSVKIAKAFDMDHKMIYPVKLSFFKNYVERPKNTCFITTKMQKVLGLKPTPSKAGLAHLKSHPLTDKTWKQL